MPNTALSENLYRLDTPEGRIRRANLEEYLRRILLTNPKVIIVGEAPGYQGTSRTGVPFGSEVHITGSAPEIRFFQDVSGFQRVYHDARLYKEPTSTYMWRAINRCREIPFLWASYPLHPHQPGNLQSNRTPTRAEVQSTRGQLVELIGLLSVEKVIALGNIARTTLDALGIDAQKVRHPSMGGSRIFAEQLYQILPLRDEEVLPNA